MHPSLASACFFNHPAPPGIYTLSLHDALPISLTTTKNSSATLTSAIAPFSAGCWRATPISPSRSSATRSDRTPDCQTRSEEHTSELQSRQYLVCRLLLEKKNQKTTQPASTTPP